MKRCLCFSVVLGPFAIALLAIFVGLLEQTMYTSLPKSNHLGPIRHTSPMNTSDFGRFTKPLKHIDYHWVSDSVWYNFFSLKHWDYKSVTTEHYFIVAAIAHFNYIATTFVYIVDRRTPQNKKCYQYSSRSLLANTIEHRASSSIEGCTVFMRSSTEYVRLCYDTENQQYLIQANVPSVTADALFLDIKIPFSVDSNPSMVLLYPVQIDRPVYTHKIATLPAHGKIRIGQEQEVLLMNGLSTIDWTLGYPERVCHWKWVSFSTIGINASNNETIAIGINLSDHVYNDQGGISMEAALWLGAEIHTMGSITYDLPEDQNYKIHPWKIASSGQVNPGMPQIQLTFQPWGSQEEHTNAVLLAGDFVQLFGEFHGSIDLFGHTYTIENGFGVTESHFAKW